MKKNTLIAIAFIFATLATPAHASGSKQEPPANASSSWTQWLTDLLTD